MVRRSAWGVMRTRLIVMVIFAGLGGSAAEVFAEGRLVVAAGVAEPATVDRGGLVDLGNVALGADGHRYLTLGNAGDALLTFDNTPAITINGADAALFAVNIQPTGHTLGRGDAVMCNIGFRPQVTGRRAATVTIVTSGAAEPDFVFTVAGTGVAAPASADQPLMRVFELHPDFEFGKREITDGGKSEFADTPVGEARTMQYAIENHGGAELLLVGSPPITTTIGPTGFEVASIPQARSIPAAGGADPAALALVFSVRFTPYTPFLQTAQVSIDSNDPRLAGPLSFEVWAAGVSAGGASADCNHNGVDDAEDIATAGSQDCNANGVPDECEFDADGDGVIDDCDVCPGERDGLDTDKDGVPDCLDNCPQASNAGQADTDGDGAGDACDAAIDDPTNGQPTDGQPTDGEPADSTPASGPGCGAVGLLTLGVIALGLTRLRRSR
jgi:hypothetical protein